MLDLIEQLVESDLLDRGITAGQYDCVVILSPDCFNQTFHPANQLFGTTGLIQLCWLGTHWVEGAGIHEFDHFIDFMFVLNEHDKASTAVNAVVLVVYVP